jgi:hypothetical protein
VRLEVGQGTRANRVLEVGRNLEVLGLIGDRRGVVAGDSQDLEQAKHGEHGK